MTTADLLKVIERCIAVPDGAALPDADRCALLDAVGQFPAVAVVPLLLLRHSAGLDAGTIAEMRNLVALLASDPRMLAFAAYGDSWKDFYPAVEAQPMQTTDVIDTFLRTYGSCTPEEEALLERMIFNPTPDYSEMLARQEQAELPDEDSQEVDPDSDEAKINAFIRQHHPAGQRPDLMPEPEPDDSDGEKEKLPVSRPEHTDDSLLSESLAKIFIKQGRYERAYEIISSLNLKFPKKSAYFADQLRFLQKLIINRRRQDELDAPGATEK